MVRAMAMAMVLAMETTVVMAMDGTHEVRDRHDAGCMRCMVRMMHGMHEVPACVV